MPSVKNNRSFSIKQPGATATAGRPSVQGSARLIRRRSSLIDFGCGDGSMGRMSGHPPFSATVILNGHEYVAAQAPGGWDRVH